MVLTPEVGSARDSELHLPGHFANAPQSTPVIPSKLVGIRPNQVENLRRRQRCAGERILDLQPVEAEQSARARPSGNVNRASRIPVGVRVVLAVAQFPDQAAVWA